MFDIGWSELVVIAVVAIIVVGPKDMPRMLRSVGQMARQARKLANDFKASISDAINEAEFDEVKKSIHHVTNFDPATWPEPYIDPTKPAAEKADQAEDGGAEDDRADKNEGGVAP